MDSIIRPADRRDTAALVALIASEGSSVVTGDISHDQIAPDGYVAQRMVALAHDGSLLGSSWVARAPWRPDGWFELQVVVDSAQRGQGIGTALVVDALQLLEQQGWRTLQCHVRDGDAVALRFAQQHGFSLSQRFFTMVLDVASFDANAFQAVVQTAEAAGFSFFTFADVANQPDAARKLYELNRRLAPDLPGNDDSFPTFEEYAHEIIGADWFRPEGQFIVADGERWVGLVGMGFDDAARTMSHEFSAVDRAYRGRRLGMALKVQSAMLAQRLNMERIVTGNDSTNTAIVALNHTLGYREQPGICKLLRER
ncbi:GNAT family N-acetyltransferase [Herpetosiphon sp. NSE202]|uniref:GNAT family N-acetyltransferase n=1 Tax=Herpetosiphon sp. NSE202 TaxID=3351349 RepID=UPI00362E40C0